MEESPERRIERINYYLEFSNAIMPRLDQRGKEYTSRLIKILRYQKEIIEEKRDETVQTTYEPKEIILDLKREAERDELNCAMEFISRGMSRDLAYAIALKKELGAFLCLEMLRKMHNIPESFPREYKEKLKFKTIR